VSRTTSQGFPLLFENLVIFLDFSSGFLLIPFGERVTIGTPDERYKGTGTNDEVKIVHSYEQ
jgi:hypothetical protein